MTELQGSAGRVARTARQYAAAVGFVLAATLVRRALAPYAGGGVPYLMYFVAVVAAAWVGGWGPGMLAVVLGAAGAAYLFIPREGPLSLSSPAGSSGLVLYLVAGLWIVTMTEYQKRARRRAERSERRAIEDRSRLEREVFERRRSERALRQSEERFRLAAEAVDGVVYEFEASGGTYTWRRGLFEMLGHHPEDAPPSSSWWRELVHPDDLAAIPTGEAQDARVGDHHHAEYRVRHKRGHYLHVLDRNVAARGADGRVARAVGCIQDLTEIRRAEQALREADRQKAEFLDQLDRQIRNPLAPIESSLRMLKRHLADDPEFAGDLETLDRQVRRLIALVNEMREVAEIGRGEVELCREVVELAPRLEKAVEASRPLFDERRAALTYEPPDRPIRLEADPSRLDQIFAGLLRGAAGGCEPGDRVVLRLAREGDEVAIRLRAVARPGPADDPEASEAREHASSTVGLDLIKALVELHGGSLAADRAGVEPGERGVTVRLPAIAEAAGTTGGEAGPVPSNGTPAGERRRRRFLVVDDNEDAARSLARVLERLYHQEVRVAFDGPSALEMLGDYGAEVVLLDLGMPGMDGFEVASRIKRRPGLDGVTIVALTGWGQDADRRRTREAGFDAHLVKPVDPDVLLAMLDGLLAVR